MRGWFIGTLLFLLVTSIAAMTLGGGSLITRNAAFIRGQSERGLVLAQAASPTATTQPTDTPSPSPTPALTPTPSEDLLGVYERVLDTSVRTVEEVRKTTESILLLIGVVFTILTVAGIGAVWQAMTAKQRVAEAVTAAESAKKTIKRVGKKQRKLNQSIVAAQETLAITVQRVGDVRKDIPELKRSLNLIEVDMYALGLFSLESEKRQQAVTVLLEVTNRGDPIIRRRSIKALRFLQDYNPQVESRLTWLIENDEELGIRKTAQVSLEAVLALREQGEDQG